MMDQQTKLDEKELNNVSGGEENTKRECEFGRTLPVNACSGCPLLNGEYCNFFQTKIYKGGGPRPR